ncbi:hypothetical protein FKX85_02380 [Echinicola soli]|uniref:Uncharacterized protein n=1 Tax=Echinicola soli TaxID=2591634 RepID=A0A514CDQ1_9BACT|nr:hypothetical protein [Echinicola soli]QDH77945.1 hypothetical protein FKX85_02380 [Echinicola soli]
MSKIVFNGSISGVGHHFGDNFYLNPESFIQNSDKIYSKTEQELIEIIFKNFQSEDQKRELLNSLIGLSNTPEENTTQAPIWRQFINQLVDLGSKEAASIVIDFTKGLIPNVIENLSL